MEPTLKQAIFYWHVFQTLETADALRQRNLLPEYLHRATLEDLLKEYGLLDTYVQIIDNTHRNKLISIYGHEMENSPMSVCRAMLAAKKSAGIDSNYKLFAEIITLSKVIITPSYALQHWLRSRNTLEFLFIWEQRNNLAFNKENAKAFIMEADKSNTTISLKK